MPDIVALLRSDLAEIVSLVSSDVTDPAQRDRLCDLLDQHCVVEDTILFPAMRIAGNSSTEAIDAALEDHARIHELVDAVRASGSELTPDDLAEVRRHVASDASTILDLADELLSAEQRADLAQRTGPLVGPVDAATASPDDGASSDGDRSWAQEPVTQDPDADRSVDAAIRRTGGR